MSNKGDGNKGVISGISNPGDEMFITDIDQKRCILDAVKAQLLEDLDEEDFERLVNTVDIQVVNDDDMPYLEDGTVVDILLNSSGAVRR